ncbi:PilZ domain-containing protein [Pseudoxanthomonas putridarboris]|uniref:PilZ domain-containing protein n=1 Tax=Pseudoxanthomonas putridarboris TaxID=752605 RepID=A0ABU9J553_9GAMM
MIREFRRARRRNVPKPVTVFDLMTEQAIGRLGNVSESGMLLIATAPVVDDALYQLRFHLRDERGQDVPIDVGAHLLWSAQANTPGQAFAGLRFLTIEREPLELLRRWVNAGPEAE